MMKRAFFVSAGLLLALGSPAASQPAATGQQPSTAATVTLPGGATSVQEVYEDWTVSCSVRQGSEQRTIKTCALTQEQVDSKTRQRVLAAELRPGKTAEPVIATFILPLGLDVQKGVSLQLDDSAPGSTHRIRTCLPTGCLAEVELDGPLLAGLSKSKLLKLIAVANGGPEMPFTISLKGFQSAYSRTQTLSK